MSKMLEFENRDVWVGGDYSEKNVYLKNARVHEGMSRISEIKIEFLSGKKDLDIQDFLGKKMWVGIKDSKNSDRFFSGICVSVEYLGLYQGLSHFIADVRPWVWLLTRTHENRIFQDKTAVDIITEIVGEYGFGSALKKSLNEAYKPREYCVQYKETDYDFICRLMEEEGIYFFFEQDAKAEKMVLADGISAHSPTPKHSEIEFHYREEDYRRREDHIFEWNEAAQITTGKVTLDDYDFEKPKADLKTVNTIQKGKHSYKSKEHYRYPGNIRTSGTNARFARVRMEALAVEHELCRGVCNIRTFGVGQTFKLKEHPRKDNNVEHLVVEAVHHFQIETDYEDDESSAPLIDNRLPVDERNTDTYRCFFDVIPKTVPYRAPQVTPWPEIPGLQTAVVTGPSGEEIHTDKHGRIKVQFHWDRLGKKDDKTTCWIRCVMPWTGKNWGMIAIPRVGQEVAVQFEEGDPDRPICTGMLYNNDTMPPYTLPDNKTMTGMTTRSTKEGSAKTHHELVFEDKKDKEYVRFQSERDYLQIVKNNALINIGGDHKDKGDLTQWIHRNKTEVVGDARTSVMGLLEDVTVGYLFDETVGVRKNQTVGVYKEEKIGLKMPSLDNIVEDVVDLAVTIGGPVSTVAYGGKYGGIGEAATKIAGLKGLGYGKKSEINGELEMVITGNYTKTISKSVSPAPSKPGDMKTVVEDGNQLNKVDKGNQVISVLKGDRQIGVETGDLITGVDKGDMTTTVKAGDIKAKASGGKVTYEAMKSIELKVGGSSIKIEPTKITISSMQVDISGEATVTMSSPTTEVSGDVMLTLKGGMTKIN